MANPFCHLELNTTDTAKAKNFYTSLFSWELSDMEMGSGGSYTFIKPGEGPGGAIAQHPVPGAPSAWLTYISVDDIHVSTEKAASLGAKIMRDVTEVPGMGWFSIILDPTGATLGLWQAKQA
ncbi:VOC family protein [Granulicella sp. L60]|jgi:uncharacterized protein|uniref:VOC family protein n=1 Tax=Granulicella sp. L60 TaxID=1641866 RepID=UPI00131CCD95|nr:VOC family protein [Granulicella sp. L60]